MTRPQEIGERVQKLRRAFCMTGSQLAHRAGFHANTLLRIERDEGYPSMENLCKVADALRCSTDYLLGRTETPW